MVRNPVENNPVTRVILGLVVILGMFAGGAAGATILLEFGVPYGNPVGVLLGGILAFTVFAALYVRYDANFDKT